MKQTKKQAGWNISTKLILINAMIFLVVGGIILVVNGSFQRIQDSLTITIRDDVNQVIQNARLGRELNRTFTDINTLIRTLYDENLQLNEVSQKLLDNVRELNQQASNNQMQGSLQEFWQELQLLFTKGEKLRQDSQLLQGKDRDMLTLLADLEDMLSEKLVILTMEEGDVMTLQQISALIPGYRETLLRITIYLTKLQQEHSGNQDINISEVPNQPAEDQHPGLFMLFEELHLRFRALLGTDPEVSQYGQHLINELQKYQELIRSFHGTLQEFDFQVTKMNQAQENILGIMRESDVHVAQTTEKIQQDIVGIIGKSKGIIVVLTSIVLGVLVLGWLATHWMTRPLLDLSFAAAQLADGNLDFQVKTVKSRDEIGTLSNAFKGLISYFHEMAHTATEISHGNFDLDVHPRSSRDVFGNRFQQMISYLKEIGQIASHVAEGDLRSQVTLQSSNDQLGNAFTHMQDGLIRLIEGIRSGAEYLSSISTQVLSTATKNSEALGHIGNAAEVTSSAMQQMRSSAEEVHLSTEHLRSSVDETSTSITEMIVSVKHVAENSRKLSAFASTTLETVSQIVSSLEKVAAQTEDSNTLAKATTEDAVSGQHSVDQMIERMTAISEVTENISSIILRLEQRSLDIGTILDVINEVADQTSLLALNASIIAAQAGVHGRGFAVVAAEIKELATRVGTSTKEISRIIKQVQSDSSEAAKVIEQGQLEVENGVLIASEAGAALDKIGQSAGDSSKVAAEIAVLVRQQTTASTHVADSMKDVADMISEISLVTEEQERNSSQVLQIVQNMQSLAEQVLRAMREQQQSTEHVTEFMEDVTTLVSQNKPTVEQLARTAHELSAQAENLSRQVERFVVPEQNALVPHSSIELQEYEEASVQ